MDFDADDLKKKYGKYLPAGANAGKLQRKVRKVVHRVEKRLKEVKFSFAHLIFILGLLFMTGNIALSFRSHHNNKHHGPTPQAGHLSEAARSSSGQSSVLAAVAGKIDLARASTTAQSRKMASFGKLPMPGGFSDRVEDLIKKTKCSTNFFLAWTTPAESFTLRYRRTVESTLRFHPDSCVIVISPTLPLDYFQVFWDLGYNIIVERPETEKLIQGTPAEHWWSNIEKWRTGPFFFSHHTEILRLATLWHYGGVYLDTDVIIMKPLKPDLHNCLGTELAGKYGESKVLNGAILVFEKGSRFIWEAMHEFNSTYRIDSWGWNGPELVTRVSRRFQHHQAQEKKERIELKQLKRRSRGRTKGGKHSKTFQESGQLYMEKMQTSASNEMAAKDLTVLPTDAFYPIHWAVVKKYFTLEDMQDQYKVWNRIEKNTYLFHYWNKVTKDLVPEPGSLMYKVLNNYCLLCNESATDDGLPLRPAYAEEEEDNSIEVQDPDATEEEEEDTTEEK
ncbi:glycosyltransferase [Chloropicon primus]|uniref:Glycosyltransferase n=1 Tax=Chloropicon primus TaxID=1764295 RepID=A0A5B8N218_9CHLO|nr:glycosyltransferase [Chloropicon primus]|eukprot:QDZ25905.1 glycosyltransferase [Chloropicon primus]